jgi:hypothetical protein
MDGDASEAVVVLGLELLDIFSSSWDFELEIEFAFVS